MPSFNRPRLTLSNNKTQVDPVDVNLDDNHCFVVSSSDPWAEDGGVLLFGAHPRPFSIVSLSCKKLNLVNRTAKLAMDQSAIADWLSEFNSGRAIVMTMQLTNGIALDLTVDLFVDQAFKAAEDFEPDADEPASAFAMYSAPISEGADETA